MKIGCVKEIKNNEYRVGLTSDNVKAYVAAGHHVYIEKGAGVGSGFTDNEYVDAGASLIDNASDVWRLVDMMIKVKEPLECEYPLFHEGLILYTYLHLAADKEQMDALLDGKVKAVAYETIQEKDRAFTLSRSYVSDRWSPLYSRRSKVFREAIRRRGHSSCWCFRHAKGECGHSWWRYCRYECLQDSRGYGSECHDS